MQQPHSAAVTWRQSYIKRHESTHTTKTSCRSSKPLSRSAVHDEAGSGIGNSHHSRCHIPLQCGSGSERGRVGGGASAASAAGEPPPPRLPSHPCCLRPAACCCLCCGPLACWLRGASGSATVLVRWWETPPPTLSLEFAADPGGEAAGLPGGVGSGWIPSAAARAASTTVSVDARARSGGGRRCRCC